MIHPTEVRASASGYAAALAGVLIMVLAGCRQRQEIIEQTVRAHGETAAARVESSYVPDEYLTWDMVAEIDPEFENATAIFVDQADALYVAGDHSVRVFDLEGRFVREISVENTPTCIAVGYGMMAVGYRGHVTVLAADGASALEIAPHGGRTWITGVALSSDAVYVADAGNRKLTSYGHGGWINWEIGSSDPERHIPALSVPSPHLEVAVDSGGDVWLNNPGRRSLQRHSSDDGALLSSFGRSSNDLDGFSGCCNPTDFALLPDGRLVTAEKGIPRVKVYSAEGEFLSVVIPPDGFSGSVEGIGVSADSQARIAVLDPQRGVVQIYEERIDEDFGEDVEQQFGEQFDGQEATNE